MENQIQEVPSETTTKPKRARRPSKRPRDNDEKSISTQTVQESTVAEIDKVKNDAKSSAWSIEDFPVVEVEGKVRFHDLNIPDRVIKSIAEMGFEYCSEIQAETLPMTLQGYDIIGQAQTGTGKTAAFLIAMISDFLDYPLEEKRANNLARGLIIAPTRELALQIADEAEKLTSNCHLNVVSLVGGLSYEKQKIALETENVDILVATPGRLLDFARNRKVLLSKVECLVLDEADRMLSMGFIPDVKSIIRMTPQKEVRQTMLFIISRKKCRLFQKKQLTKISIR